MKNKSSKPAMQLALAFIKDNLEKGVWRNGDRLPPVRKLAVQASVSLRTMVRVIIQLKSQALLGGIQRGRLIAGSGKAAISPDSPLPVWRAKRAALEQDILSGMYAEQGRLPSAKELQARYGASFRTIRKILYSLSTDKVTRLVNKKHELLSVSGSAPGRRIVFISPQSHLRAVSALNQGQNRIFDLLEYECLRHGLKLEIVEIDLFNPAETRLAALSDPIAGPALGYILDLWLPPGGESSRSLQYLLARLGLLKKPIGILDEIGDFILPAEDAVNPLMQVFRIEGRKAGNRIARVLLGMRHRSCVFLSSIHDASWSQQRLAGVVEEYEKAGMAAGVVPITGKKAEINQHYVLAISGFDGKLIRQILAANRSESETEAGYQDYLRYAKTFSPEQFSMEDIREIKERLGIISNVAGRKIDKALFDTLCEDIFAGIALHLNKKSRAPLFEQALACREATAWICANDNMAMTALSFLRERSIAVPQQI
jgi:DNA-binding transcriptional regulator YhcF (GntR family)